MTKKIWVLVIASLVSTSLQAGTFKLKQGNLANTDKIDITWKQQYGNCPTKFPVESMNCTYISSDMGGLQAQYINKLSAMFTVENTFFLSVKLNEETKKKGYPFNEASCQNLQGKIKNGSLITINKTGCNVR
jgi:hypothetical protein